MIQNSKKIKKAGDCQRAKAAVKPKREMIEATRPKIIEVTRPKINVVKPKISVAKPKNNEIRPKDNIIKPKFDVIKPKDDIIKPKFDVIKPKDWVKIAWLSNGTLGGATYRRLKLWGQKKGLSLEEIWVNFEQLLANGQEAVLTDNQIEATRKWRQQWGAGLDAGRNFAAACLEQEIGLLLRPEKLLISDEEKLSVGDEERTLVSKEENCSAGNKNDLQEVSWPAGNKKNLQEGNWSAGNKNDLQEENQIDGKKSSRADKAENWPPLLEEIPNPPEILFYRGRPENLVAPLPLAVVGTRRMTLYGRQATRKIISELAIYQPTIVSGFMYGIDQAAHQAALDYQVPTIGILGMGLADKNWQRQNATLIARMLANDQTLISEFPPWTGARAQNFPIRNRLVAGMSWATIVIEAAVKSGSLITAELATNYGRDVWAVPGPITSIYAEGTKKLLQDGAGLASYGGEIIAGLQYQTRLPSLTTNSDYTATQNNNQSELTALASLLEPIERQILLIIQENSQATFDDIWQISHLSVPEIQAALTMLKVQNFINQDGEIYTPNC